MIKKIIITLLTIIINIIDTVNGGGKRCSGQQERFLR